MFEDLKKQFETYFLCLSHPYKFHSSLRFDVPFLNDYSEKLEPLSFPMALSISWFFSILRGLGKILILNLLIQSLLEIHLEELPIIGEILQETSISAYSFLILSSSLDIIFFPVGLMIATEFWTWVIKKFADYIDPTQDNAKISHEITTHALTSNAFIFLPFIGDFIQLYTYVFLLYVGLRVNLGVSRSLASVILLTPLLIGVMIFSLVSLGLFYLI